MGRTTLATTAQTVRPVNQYVFDSLFYYLPPLFLLVRIVLYYSRTPNRAAGVDDS